jgi:hypothetical protein
MAFKNCACYVLAVTGYKDDAQMALVGKSNEKASGDQSLKKLADNDLRLAAIVNAMRAECETGGNAPPTDKTVLSVPITIYGRFNSNKIDVAPMHFWIECGGYIIEKWTDNPLVYQLATDATRQQPQSLASVDPKTYTVGKYSTTLTVFQAKNIFDNALDLFCKLSITPPSRR